MVDKVVVDRNGLKTHFKNPVNPLAPSMDEVAKLKRLKPMGEFTRSELLKQIEEEEAGIDGYC